MSDKTDSLHGDVTSKVTPPLERMVSPCSVFVPLTKENQKYHALIKNKHGKKAVIDTTNWMNRGCWVYYTNIRKGREKITGSGLLEYDNFKKWLIQG